jgi:hypothetical protein
VYSLAFEVRIQLRLAKGTVDLVRAQDHFTDTVELHVRLLTRPDPGSRSAGVLGSTTCFK